MSTHGFLYLFIIYIYKYIYIYVYYLLICQTPLLFGHTFCSLVQWVLEKLDKFSIRYPKAIRNITLFGGNTMTFLYRPSSRYAFCLFVYSSLSNNRWSPMDLRDKHTLCFFIALVWLWCMILLILFYFELFYILI